MYQYYALPFPSETLENCKQVARYKNGAFERYQIVEHTWLEDSELFGIHCGKYEAELITKEQAKAIIKRLGGSLHD